MSDKTNQLVATDFCEKCVPAARYAIERAEKEGRDVHFIHGAYRQGNPDNVPPQADATDEELHRRMNSWIRSIGLNPDETASSVVRASTPVEAILTSAIYLKSDELVVGKCRDGWAGLLNGDRVSKSVISHSIKPVVVVS